MKPHFERMLGQCRGPTGKSFRLCVTFRPPGSRGCHGSRILLAAEHIWLSRITAREAGHPVWPGLDLAGCERLRRKTLRGI